MAATLVCRTLQSQGGKANSWKIIWCLQTQRCGRRGLNVFSYLSSVVLVGAEIEPRQLPAHIQQDSRKLPNAYFLSLMTSWFPSQNESAPRISFLGFDEKVVYFLNGVEGSGPFLRVWGLEGSVGYAPDTFSSTHSNGCYWDFKSVKKHFRIAFAYGGPNFVLLIMLCSFGVLLQYANDMRQVSV